LEEAVSPRRTVATGQIARIRAPFSLRCGAFLIDYSLLIGIFAFSTLVARFLGGGSTAAGNSTLLIGAIVAVGVSLLNLAVLASIRGQTVGKWATGLRIERIDGQPIGVGRIIVRNILGYLFSTLTLGIGFLIAILSQEGRALHDLIAGTIIVRE
jgi:uncharacterized RDD family membrane protein YckC